MSEKELPIRQEWDWDVNKYVLENFRPKSSVRKRLIDALNKDVEIDKRVSKITPLNLLQLKLLNRSLSLSRRKPREEYRVVLLLTLCKKASVLALEYLNNAKSFGS